MQDLKTKIRSIKSSERMGEDHGWDPKPEKRKKLIAVGQYSELDFQP
jgi:hypothetical protein